MGASSGGGAYEVTALDDRAETGVSMGTDFEVVERGVWAR